MKETLETINRMQADGVIGKYAIGGAVGATFYLEPAATLDVDIFVNLPHVLERSLVSLSPIYDYLASRGYKSEGEHIIIGTWPVQFLVPSNALEREALAEAVQADAGGVPTWVMTAEHLIAIALHTGRAKDYARIVSFLEHKAGDQRKLDNILTRHNLVTRWEQFKKRFS